MAPSILIPGPTNPVVLIGVVVLSALVFCCVTLIRNLYFHPLSKFPGPKIAAVSNLWYAYVMHRGVAPIEMSNLHKRYGPVIRVAPDELSFSSAVAFKEIYGHQKAGRPELVKDKKYHKFVPEPILINADREYHGTLRKLLSHGFSESALRAQEAVIQEHVSILMQRLREHGHEGQVAVDVLRWYNVHLHGFEHILYRSHAYPLVNLAYGQSFGCLASSSIHPYVELMFHFIKLASTMQVMQRLPAVMKYPYAMWTVPKDVKVNVAEMKALSNAKVNYRMENPPPIPDFMAKLVEAHREGKMTFNQLVGNSDVLLGAGSETTATALSGLTFLLMTHPRVLNKLTEELRERFSSAEEITAVGVNKCKYLLAVVEEGLRIYPPSPATHPRYTPPGGITIDDHFVPGNMAVGVTILAACVNEDNFVDGDKFIPERWTGEDSRFDGDKKQGSQPFSYGPRNCAGRNLAYLELKLIIANLVWHFDLENCHEGDWMDQKIYMVWQKGPLMVKLKPVKRS
ncbi:unnamed protein product [Clonostachys chloroleuca]|uniref:Cytochrome P450 n=1 Tax=Clonostachys chloroleuca TaxID=1926264 RepID=A0AA35Q5V8_9HYPO|nr:unnamed protein product [Clonostachys chloroleuca]